MRGPRLFARASPFIALVALRVGASVGAPNGGMPWWVWVEEMALGAGVYVFGLLAIAAPFVAFGALREAIRVHRDAPLTRSQWRVVVGACVACLALTTAYVGLMVRYDSSPRPLVRYRMEHPPSR